MSGDWPSRALDLHLAQEIIQKHHQKGKPVSLFEVVFQSQKESGWVQVSPWVLALRKEFIDEYGKQKGEETALKVVSSWIMAGERVH